LHPNPSPFQLSFHDNQLLRPRPPAQITRPQVWPETLASFSMLLLLLLLMMMMM
jgi:hypothetical protein